MICRLDSGRELSRAPGYYKSKAYLLFCVHDLKRFPLCLCSFQLGKAARL